MTDLLRRFEDVVAAIAKLPSTPAGHVRVFRGQTKDYPNILPSGLRRSIRNETIWRLYAENLYADFMPEATPGHPVSQATLEAWLVWLQAVAQHYGPGSYFVDVTHSVEVALWFALNTLKTWFVPGATASASRDPKNPGSDPTLVELLRCEPWDGTGYLYVWDLPQWDGHAFPEPGVIVDISYAPPAFSESPRMRAQQACLVYCGPNPREALDLRSGVVLGTPLQVARPMTGTIAVARPVSEMFPSPAIDRWYDRLLCVPMEYAPCPLPPRLRRSIPVAVYDEPGNANYTHDANSREVSCGMPLVHRFIAEEPPPLAIVLEAPLIFPLPPGDSPQWHHALLATDVATACDAFELPLVRTDEFEISLASRVTLNDVLFQFSLLEYTGWERVLHEREDHELLRGVWLRRGTDGWEVAFLYDGTYHLNFHTVGFLRIRLDESGKRWVFQNIGPVDEYPTLAKALFLALMILRHLSPTLKAEVLPAIEVVTSPERSMCVGVSRDTARLYRVPSPDRDWYVVREAANPEEPFAAQSANVGTFELRANSEYRDIDVERIHAAVNAATSTSAREFLQRMEPSRTRGTSYRVNKNLVFGAGLGMHYQPPRPR